MSLSALPDDAALRVLPCHPPLAPAAAAEAVAALRKLVEQFVREGALRAAAVESAPTKDGRIQFVLMSWCGELS
ncbi:MAG: hypothetical protein ACYTF0_03840, partial [Planctomycetota bacterium]